MNASRRSSQAVLGGELDIMDFGKTSSLLSLSIREDDAADDVKNESDALSPLMKSKTTTAFSTLLKHGGKQKITAIRTTLWTAKGKYRCLVRSKIDANGAE